MTIHVKGRNVEVTPAMKDYVEKKIAKITKQFKAVGDITAVLKIEHGYHISEITVPANGILLRAQESTKDMYSSIDLVVEKIERQIHKYKTRLMKRKYANFAEAPAPAPAVEEDGEFEIIKNKKFALNPMSVEEAILQMNLLNHDFFMFFNICPMNHFTSTDIFIFKVFIYCFYCIRVIRSPTKEFITVRNISIT